MKSLNIFHRYLQPTRHLRSIAAVLMLSCLANAARALDPAKAVSQYVHTQWGRDRGFPGGTIYAISQSGDGYLWLGTDRGLVRFDGEAFTLIQRPFPGQPLIGPVRGLAEDSEGNLWIRPQGEQLLVYRDGEFKNAILSLGFPLSTITAMGHDGQGGVLFSGFGSLLMRYTHGKFERVADESDTPGTVISITEARDRRIWIGTRDAGLFVIRDGKQATSVAPNLASYKINALAAANDGGLWIGTDQGMRFLPVVADTTVALPSWNRDCQVLAILKDRDGSMWAASSRGLIRVTSTGLFSLLPTDGEEAAEITAVFEDSDGSIWFGGPKGLERLQDGVFATYSQREGLPKSNGGALYVDGGGRIWFAPVSGGVYCLENGRIAPIRLQDLDRDIVYSITGRGNDVWLGRQRGGLTRITRIGKEVSAQTYTQHDGLAQNTVFAVLMDREGAVWAGTLSGGVSRLKNGIFTTYSTVSGLNANAVNAIAEAYDGTIWVGTSSGLNAFRNGAWSHWTTGEGLPSNEIRSCFEDSMHVLWAVTASGLARLSERKFVTPNSVPDQLRDQLLGMTEDALGYFWISTMDRVVRVSRDRLIADNVREPDLQVFGEAEGLNGAEGIRRDRPIITDKNGKVWVSVQRGIAAADPLMTIRNSRPIRVRIESVTAGGISSRVSQPLRIGPRTHSVMFRFSGASLDSPDHIWYRYLLEGADQGWSEPVRTRQVSYNNLDAGAYRFRVMASHDENLWNGTESDAAFSIDHAFWQTWWFRACCLLAAALLAMTVLQMRTVRLSRQLNARFQERLAERTRIAQELHDTLLQSFQGLMLRFQTVDSMLPSKPADAKQILEDALDRADDALTESRDAIQNIRSSPSRHPDLSRALASILEEVEAEFPAREHSGPTCSVVVEGKEQMLQEPVKAEMCRIARESLRNAFQHAHASRIEVEILFQESALRLRLRDDGVGIEPSILTTGARSGHWGLIGMRERAARLGAHIDFWSKPGAGTEIAVTLPGEIAYIATSETPFKRFYKRIKS